MYFLLIIILLTIDINGDNYSPYKSYSDGYGVKISGNEIMLVESLSDSQVFVIRYCDSNCVECSINCNDSNKSIYSVGIGKKQNLNELYFYYGGEMISNNERGNFIGILINKDSDKLFNCDQFKSESFQFVSSYEHQEFFVFGVEPYGQYAIGLTKDFLFIYRPFSDNQIRIKSSNTVWPMNTIFVPISVSTGISFTVVAGFIINGPLFRVRATPTVYVLSNIDLTVLSKWSYTPVFNSWQSELTYSNLKRWPKKYIMSVNINLDDPSQILVGMPFINIVFLLNVNLNGTNLRLNSFIDNGNSVGFGKSVTWLSNFELAILNSDYETIDSSKILFYKLLNNNSLSLSPFVIFPNIQQRLPRTMNSHLIEMISSSNSLVVVDIDSQILVIFPSLPGYFSSTSLSSSDSMFIISESLKCMGGTYKSDISIYPCSLCPSGKRNPGNFSYNECINCSSNTFCPIGSVADIDIINLISVSQAYVHPRSPEVTVFDEILLQNMFSTGSNDHCIFLSPLFWVLTVIVIVLLILLIMCILKQFVQHPKGHQVRNHMKKIFRQTDLIHEGELWVGGLVSFAIIVFLIFAYIFSSSFYREYPSDDSSPSTFACNEIIRNVKYESGLQSLSIPASKEEQPMIDLLNKQHFTLRLDLLNTIASCKSLSVERILGSSTTKIIPNCTNSIGILSAKIDLSYKKMMIKWIVNDIVLIGAVRFSLSSDEMENEFYRLKELNFIETFYDKSNRTLSQSTTIHLELTKSINETEPLIGHQSKFSGIWYPTFRINENDMFISSDQYTTSNYLTSTTLTIILSETSYYIKNRQLPIAKIREIIFHNLLFTIVCLELFRLIILLCKLTIIPPLNLIMRRFPKKNQSLSTNVEIVDHDIIIDDHDTITDNHSITTKDYHIIQVDL